MRCRPTDLGLRGIRGWSHWYEVTWGGIIHQIESMNKAVGTLRDRTSAPVSRSQGSWSSVWLFRRSRSSTKG